MSASAQLAGQRAILYGRVSKAANGAAARSVDSQLAVGREWADRNGIEVAGEYRDDGISAFGGGTRGRRERPAWKQVMAELATGQVNILWCWEISRASRDRDVSAKLITTCRVHEVLLAIGDRVHDVDDPDDGFMIDLTAALAVRESAQTRKRILRTVAAQAQAGRPHGKIPYGYRREYDPDTGALARQVRDPDTAPILEEMARRVLAGESLYAIANDLNERGVPPPNAVRAARVHGGQAASGLRWLPVEVRWQVLNPTAAGQRVHHGEVVATGTWPPIISPADQAAIAALLTGPRRWRSDSRAVVHLLTGIAECGVCGTPLRRTKNRGYPSYSCPGADGRGSSCVSRLQEPVDMLVEETVFAFFDRPDVSSRLAVDTGDEKAAAAARELADLRARLQAFIRSAASGGVSPEALAEIEADLRPRIADAQRRATPTQVPPVVAALAGGRARVLWKGYDLAQKRQVVRFLMRVIVHRSGQKPGQRGFDPRFVEVIWRVGQGAPTGTASP